MASDSVLRIKVETSVQKTEATLQIKKLETECDKWVKLVRIRYNKNDKPGAEEALKKLKISREKLVRYKKIHEALENVSDITDMQKMIAVLAKSKGLLTSNVTQMGGLDSVLRDIHTASSSSGEGDSGVNVSMMDLAKEALSDAQFRDYASRHPPE